MKTNPFKLKSFEEWKNSNFKDLKECFAEAKKQREERIKNNPNNGCLGWWKVVGLRHSAYAKASSAKEAIEKTSELVGDWEEPEADFAWKEPPDVFE